MEIFCHQTQSCNFVKRDWILGFTDLKGGWTMLSFNIRIRWHAVLTLKIENWPSSKISYLRLFSHWAAAFHNEVLFSLGWGWLFVKRLLDYAIKIAATWVACKKLHSRIPWPFILRVRHRASFKSFSDWFWTGVSVFVFQLMIVCQNLTLFIDLILWNTYIIIFLFWTKLNE